MLAQSLFALAVPAAPQAGDAPAAPADGAFGRLVDVATRAAEGDGRAPPSGSETARPRAAADGTGPQILPGVDQAPPPGKRAGPPRPEILPAETGPVVVDDDKALRPEVLPAEPDGSSEPPPVPDLKAGGTDGEPRPEVLPRDAGPDDRPRLEVLPVEVGPSPGAVDKASRPEVLPPPPAGPQAPPPAHGAEHDPAASRPPQTTPQPPESPEPGSVPDAPAQGPTASAADASPAPARPVGPGGAAPSPTPPPVDGVRTDAPVSAGGSEPSPAPSTDAGSAPAADGPAFGLSRVAHETLADLSAQVVKRLEGKVTRFEMALTPEDLGRVDVSLKMGEDGSLTARLAFDTPATAAEMRAQADQLRRQLEQAGFQLARDALEFSHRDGSSPRHDGFERRQNRAFAAARALADRAEAAPLIELSLSLGSARERVDVKV